MYHRPLGAIDVLDSLVPPDGVTARMWEHMDLTPRKYPAQPGATWWNPLLNTGSPGIPPGRPSPSKNKKASKQNRCKNE